MSKLWSILSSIGGVVLGVVAIFFYGKQSGKRDSENEQRKKIIGNIEKRHKIDNSVDRMRDHELDHELRDNSTKQ